MRLRSLRPARIGDRALPAVRRGMAGAALGLLLAAGTLPARAQEPAGAAPPSAPTATSTADIALTITLRADEVRYQVVPTVTVQFSGTLGRQTDWDVVHDNLPAAPEAGPTYRHVGIAVSITSTFAADRPGPTATPIPAP